MPRVLQNELEKIKKTILTLGGMVEERLHLAAKAVEGKDSVIAERIIKTDHEIDEMEIEVEEECLKILALHQPVAVDLRFLIAVIKINNDLERIADQAKNIAQRIKTISKTTNFEYNYDYGSMAEKVQDMLKKSLDALVNFDTDMAMKVCVLDDEVDELKNKVYDIVKEEICHYPNQVGYLINFLLISRHLERIADHATNIAEEVVYMTEGEIVRHGKFVS